MFSPINRGIDVQEIIDSILSQVTKNTKVIAIPHVISVYGTVMPIALFNK